MPDPITSVSHREISWPDQPADREDFRPTLERRMDERNYGVCGEPKTVISAVLCRDQLGVSNACRRAAPDSVDETLCDESKLQKVQSFFADLAQEAFRLVLGAKVGRSK